MHHLICDSIVELCIHVVHTRLSLVIEVVLDAQLRLMCMSANDSVPLVMGMVMLF